MSEEDTLIMPQTATRPRPGLTTKGKATVLLMQVRDRWDTFSPSQRAEVAELVDRLSVALRREHSLAARTPAAVRVPLLGRLTA